MRTRLMQVFPETALERILDALEHELIEASDADVLEAANDLGMKPEMKGSAAFIGLRHSSALHRAEDFFDTGWLQQVLNDRRMSWLASAASPKQAATAEPPSPPGRPRRRKAARPPKGPQES